jgi:hypothetical protein
MTIKSALCLAAHLLLTFYSGKSVATSSSLGFESGKDPSMYVPTVIERDLVTKRVKAESIVKEHNRFAEDVAHIRSNPEVSEVTSTFTTQLIMSLWIDTDSISWLVFLVHNLGLRHTLEQPW